MQRFSKPIVATVLVLGALLAASVCPSGTTAQDARSAPDGESLERKAQSVLAAVQAQSPDALFEQLAPWRRNEVELHKARIDRLVKDGTLTWTAMRRSLEGRAGLDPGNKLNLASTTDFVGLSSSKLFGLFFGFYQLQQQDEARRVLADRWFSVGRAIGAARPMLHDAGSNLDVVSEQGGQVVFRGVAGGIITVRCVADSRDWHVIDVSIGLDKFHAGVARALDEVASRTNSSRAELAWDPACAEGEQLVFSVKGLVRVAKATTAKIPTSLTAASDADGAGLSQSDVESEHYKARDTIYGTDKMGAIVVEPVDPRGTWIILVFSWTGTGGAFFYLDSKEAVETKLADLAKVGFEEKD